MNRFVFLFLIIIQYSASQNYTEYQTGSSTDISTNQEFGICLMGGASESDDAMQWFLNKANGGDVVVLRASGSDGYNDYFYSELGVSINSVTTFVINNVAGATDPYVLNKVANAEAIWFAGGNQYNYVSYFKNNAMEEVLNTFINTKQGVIGGTSAGMAILGNYYFDASNGTTTSNTALNNPYDASVSLGHNDFLNIPFLNKVITDTHYDSPDRRGRHAVFMARFATDTGMRSFGIASEEYTAVCIDAGGRASVFGDYPNFEDYAYFIQANCTTDFVPENCTPGNALNWIKDEEALKVYKVSGTPSGVNYFDVSDWKTESGGTWENWYIDNGTLMTSATVNPECDLLSIKPFEAINIAVYPNPFTNYVSIETHGYAFDAVLYKLTGEVIELRYNDDEQINTKELASGIYVLKLNLGNIEKSFKLIKE